MEPVPDTPTKEVSGLSIESVKRFIYSAWIASCFGEEIAIDQEARLDLLSLIFRLNLCFHQAAAKFCDATIVWQSETDLDPRIDDGSVKRAGESTSDRCLYQL
jgi:hypothetical protein